MADEPKPGKSLLEQYDLGDTSYNPELDGTPTPVTTTPPVATASAPAASPSPEPPKHSKRLIRMATELGFSEDEINSTPTESLDEAVYAANRAALAEARQSTRAELAAPGRPRSLATGEFLPAQPTTPETSAPQQASTPTQTPETFLTDEDRQTFDPRLVQLLESQAKQIAELKQHIGALYQRENTRQLETFSQHVDRRFAEKKELFGDKPGRQMKFTEPETRRRQAVMALVEAMSKEGGNKSFDELFDAAVASIYGSVAPPPVGNPTPPANGTAEKRWNEAALARPTHRTSDEPKGEAKALKTAARYMQEHGIGDSDEMPATDSEY